MHQLYSSFTKQKLFEKRDEIFGEKPHKTKHECFHESSNKKQLCDMILGWLILCQLDCWATGCPDITLNIVLGLTVRKFLGKIHI